MAVKNQTDWKPEIDKKKNQIIYTPKKEDDRKAQADLIKKIIIVGHTKIPTGFYKEGWGLTRPASTYLIPILEKKYRGKTITLIFKENQKFQIRVVGKKVEIKLDYIKYKQMLSELSAMKTESNKKIKSRLVGNLSQWFPKIFDGIAQTNTVTDYTPGDLSNVLKDEKKILDSLSDKDQESLVRFYNLLSEKASSNIKPRKFDQEIGQIRASKNISQRLYIQPVIKKFEDQLKKKTQSEQWWQGFFKMHLLDFNTNYHKLLDKQNIDIGIRIPDFIAIDNYNYIDVIEIKRPDTPILLEDRSHKNYYWTSDVVKAISQTENYIHSLSTGSDKLTVYLQTRESLDVRAVRPKGIIIVGSNRELKDHVKSENFRILNDSLKNITVITFDDVLTNLKSLASKLETKKKKRARRSGKKRK